MPKQRILFLTLTTFSSTGGIEKFNRAFLKALGTLQHQLGLHVTAAGMYDREVDERYFPSERYSCYGGRRIWFILRNCIRFFATDELVLGHLNLAVLGHCYRLLRPGKKLTVICHGIEVFSPASWLQRSLLQQADTVLAVSSFTKEQLITQQQVEAARIIVFPNTLDPFFQQPAQFDKPAYLLKRYGIKADEKVLFTLTRLNSKEGYKGYDTVLTTLTALVQKKYSFRYILAGKADAGESQRITKLIADNGLENFVTVAGFIPDAELTDHYLLADVFVMPSKGEGFGIVYLEAMACGLPVIAGNKDGSTEALQFGKLGTLIDPDDTDALETAIEQSIQKEKNPVTVQQQMLQYFSFSRFVERLKEVLNPVAVEASH